MKKNYLRVFESWKSLRESRKHRHMGGKKKKNRKIKNIPASKNSAKADREKSTSEGGEKSWDPLNRSLPCLAYWVGLP